MTHALILYDGVRIETGDNLLVSGSVTLGEGSEANQAQITVRNPNLRYSETLRRPDRQDKPILEIWLGETRALTKIFYGPIVKWVDAGPPELLQITAMDKTRGMRRKERAKNWSDTTPEQLIQKIALDHGIEVDLSNANLPGKAFASSIQHGETDFEFLTRLLMLHGHVIYERDGVIVVDQGERGVIDADLQYGKNISRYQFDISDKTPSSSPNIFALDGQPVSDEHEDDDALKREVTLERTGLAVTAEDFPSFTDQTIEQAARAQRTAKKRWFGDIEAAQTLPDVKAKSQVLIKGLGVLYSGVWNVERVTHDLVKPHASMRIYNGGIRQ